MYRDDIIKSKGLVKRYHDAEPPCRSPRRRYQLNTLVKSGYLHPSLTQAFRWSWRKSWMESREERNGERSFASTLSCITFFHHLLWTSQWQTGMQMKDEGKCGEERRIERSHGMRNTRWLICRFLFDLYSSLLHFPCSSHERTHRNTSEGVRKV